MNSRISDFLEEYERLVEKYNLRVVKDNIDRIVIAASNGSQHIVLNPITGNNFKYIYAQDTHS